MNYEPDLVTTAVKMLVVLVFLLGLLIAALVVSKRFLGGGGPRYSGAMMRVLSSVHVGVRKTITMVEVPGAVLVLGVTQDQIRLLTKIEDTELLNEFEMTSSHSRSGSFVDHLKRFSAKYGGKMDRK